MKKLVRWVLCVALLLVATIASAEPLHVYLTYSGAPETSIDVNVLMPKIGLKVDVYYDTQPRDSAPASYAHKARAKYHQSLIELSDDRAIYAAQLSNLKPGTVYYFIAGDAESGFTAERKFRTLPGGDHGFRFVNGGDMGVEGTVEPLLQLAAKRDPDFALIGGDIAYANGLLGNDDLWDAWLNNWDNHMVTTDGRMIPIVTAIGNHEINDYVSVVPEICAPWYTALFGRQSSESYWSFRVGDNAVFFLLDTGHLVPHRGKQTAWLREALRDSRDVRYKFAAYHVPLYPGHRSFVDSDSVQGRMHWAPLFDRYGLTVAFEHHDHVFKRSKPLRNGEIDPAGTIYVGDGCFGRGTRTVDATPRWYNEKEAATAHFWVVDVAEDGLKFEAVVDTGESIDRFTLPNR